LEIGLIGLNHKTAPVEMREQLTAACTQAGPAVEVLKDLPEVQEALFLTTCNRVEILFTSEALEAAFGALLTSWSRDLHGSAEELQRCIYTYRSDEAVRHLFRVASSLDSLVVGEPQILGQIKEAYREASRTRSTGVVLNRLLHRAFSTAKRIRTETGIAGHAVSISFAAVELAKKIFQELTGKKVLLIGAGEMAELAAEHLWNNKVDRDRGGQPDPGAGPGLAHRWQGRALPLEEVPGALVQTDIVISSTGAGSADPAVSGQDHHEAAPTAAAVFYRYCRSPGHRSPGQMTWTRLSIRYLMIAGGLWPRIWRPARTRRWRRKGSCRRRRSSSGPG